LTDFGSGDGFNPIVNGVSPYPNATNVAINTKIKAHFSYSVYGATVNTDTFFLKAGDLSVPAVITYYPDNFSAILQPLSDLEYGTTYTATVTTGVKDTFGINMVSQRTWSFTTAGIETEIKPVQI
jgi:hypothetical protein